MITGIFAGVMWALETVAISLALTITPFVSNGVSVLAALFAAVSYLFYYKTIAKKGAAKAMALNITYTAWAMINSKFLAS